MKWCCIGFKSAYDAAGQRGSAILIGCDSLNAPGFTLQYRAIDAGKENYIQLESYFVSGAAQILKSFTQDK